MKNFFLMLLLAAAPGFSQNLPFMVGEWAPFTGEKLPENGVAVAVVRAACAAAGLMPDFIWTPWKRAEISTANGTVFGAFPYIALEERRSSFFFSDILFVSEFAVLSARGNPVTKDFQFTSPASFEPYRVGLMAGTEALRLALTKAGVKFEETLLIDQSIAKLRAGRLDFVIEDRNVLREALKRLNVDSQELVLDGHRFGDPFELRLMVSRVYPQSEILLRRFNEGLAQIRVDGTFRKILARYEMAP